jgi:hypothetical protein
MNLFFNGSTTPGVTVYGQLSGDAVADPIGGTTGGTTLALNVPTGGGSDVVAGANSLSFDAGGGETATVIAYTAYSESVFNLDRVGSISLGTDSSADQVFKFTLSVVPEPQNASLLLAIGVCAALGRRSYRSRS